jgi:hypothetical protein
MQPYSLKMFQNEAKEEYLKPLIEKKEIIEYKYDSLNNEIKKIKKMYFKNLFVFENMKQQNPNLNPDFKVISEMKQLENDETYKMIKFQIDNLKNEKMKIDIEIKKIEDKFNNLFKFKNPQIYVELAKKAIKYKNIEEFEMYITELAKEISKNEFLMIEIYPFLKWIVPFDFFEYLIKKAPKIYQGIMRDIFELFKLFHIEFKYEYFKKNKNDTWEDFIDEKMLRASQEFTKIKKGD